MTASSSGILRQLLPAVLWLLTAAAPSGTNSLRHLGCHFLTNPDYVLAKAELQVGDNYDLMPFYRHSLTKPVEATPQACAQFCLTKGLEFAALRQDECACGASKDGLREAKSGGSLGEQCSHLCKGDPSQRCGGSNVISVYQSEPAVRTQLPSRCGTGYWKVMLNKTAEFQPNLAVINDTSMMWRASQMGAGDQGRLNLELCMWKCERLRTCWSVIEQSVPGKFVGCALLDRPATEAAAEIRASPPGNRQIFSLAVWTCSGNPPPPPPPPRTDGPRSKQPDSDRLEAGGTGGGGDFNGGLKIASCHWMLAAAFAAVSLVMLA